MTRGLGLPERGVPLQAPTEEGPACISHLIYKCDDICKLLHAIELIHIMTLSI